MDYEHTPATKEIDISSRTPPNDSTDLPASSDDSKDTTKYALQSQLSPDEPEKSTVLSGSMPIQASEERVAKLNRERTHSNIQAWEENKKSKVLNKYNKKLAKILSWENTKKTSAEARLKTAEEKLEKKRAGNVEKMKNELAGWHHKAEEERAKEEVKKGKELIKIDEAAAKYHAHGHYPNTFENYYLKCFRCIKSTPY